MNFKDIDKELRSKKLRPIYFLYGEEAYLIRALIEGIKKAVNSLAGSDIEVERFNGKKDGFGPVLTCCATRPMWSQRRLVLVDDASGLEVDSDLKSYFERPADFTTLILTDSSLDGRTKAGKFFTTSCAAVECKPLYDNQVPDWIRVSAENIGKKISQDASIQIADLVGNNLGEIVGALEKLALYVGKKPMIDSEDVETVLTSTGRKTVFNFLDALGRRNMGEASKMLQNLFSFNENEVMIVTMLSRHVRILLKIREALQNKKGTPEQLFAITRIPAFLLKGYVDQAKLFSTRELARAFKKLYTTDKLIKSSRVDKRVILKKCVRDIMLGWN